MGPGHMGVAQVQQISAGEAVTVLHISGGTLVACTTCNEAKQTRTSFPPSPGRATKPLAIVHMDTVGPIKKTGYDGSQYAVPVLDDYTSYVVVL